MNSSFVNCRIQIQNQHFYRDETNSTSIPSMAHLNWQHDQVPEPGIFWVSLQFEAEKNTLVADSYKDKHWRPALEAVMLAEGDVAPAQVCNQKISSIAGLPKLIIKLPLRPPAKHRRSVRKNSRNAVAPKLHNHISGWRVSHY